MGGWRTLGAFSLHVLRPASAPHGPASARPACRLRQTAVSRNLHSPLPAHAGMGSTRPCSRVPGVLAAHWLRRPSVLRGRGLTPWRGIPSRHPGRVPGAPNLSTEERNPRDPLPASSWPPAVNCAFDPTNCPPTPVGSQANSNRGCCGFQM